MFLAKFGVLRAVMMKI